MRDALRFTALVSAAFACAAAAGVAVTTPLPVGLWPRVVAALAGIGGYLWSVDMIGRAMIDRIMLGRRRS